MKAIGDDASYYMGMTFGLSDITPAREVRDKVMNEALRQYEGGPQTKERLLHLFSKANTAMEKGLDEHYAKRPNAIWDMIKSGALGKKGQAMQMISAPGIVNDENNEPIPFPVMKSYSEGLNISDYVSALYGQRKGIIDKAISTAEPGEIQKETIVAALRQQVDQKDCGAEGIPFPIDDKSIYFRFLGSDLHIKGRVIAKRGDPITHEIVDAARSADLDELPIRSAEICQSAHGVCQMDAGLNENGEKYSLGFNLGALAATTISEPLTQGVLRNFHQGNTAFSKTISGLDRMRQLIELPKIAAGEGPLSSADGKVEEIKKLSSGDMRVTVGGNHHFVPAGMLVQARVGDDVKRGDPLSSGVQNPHEILRTKGIGAARRYIADEMQKTYKEGNDIDLDKRHFEVIARTLSDHAYIDDPGDAETLIRGDYMPMTRVDAYNKMLVADGKKPIEYTPQLKGAVQAAIATDDWMARTSSRLLTRKLQEAAGFGLSTDVGPGAHPVPRYIWGVSMGKGAKEHPNVPGSIQGIQLQDLEWNGPVATSVHEVPLPKEDKIPL
jgi:DNA-directed RNA polymerase subunit beta'